MQYVSPAINPVVTTACVKYLGNLGVDINVVQPLIQLGMEFVVQATWRLHEQCGAYQADACAEISDAQHILEQAFGTGVGVGNVFDPCEHVTVVFGFGKNAFDEPRLQVIGCGTVSQAMLAFDGQYCFEGSAEGYILIIY